MSSIKKSVAALAVISVLGGATASAGVPEPDTNPQSCDNRPASLHVEKAKNQIQRAYGKKRWRDETPATHAEKKRWKEHLLCIESRERQDNIRDYRERRQAFFERYRERKLEQRRERRQERRYQRKINPPGADYLRGLRMCESGGDYGANTDNGYYGAYQFSLSTWRSVGGTGYPHLASPRRQDILAAKLYQTGGPGHWPVCG